MDSVAKENHTDSPNRRIGAEGVMVGEVWKSSQALMGE